MRLVKRANVDWISSRDEGCAYWSKIEPNQITSIGRACESGACRNWGFSRYPGKLRCPGSWTSGKATGSEDKKTKRDTLPDLIKPTSELEVDAQKLDLELGVAVRAVKSLTEGFVYFEISEHSAKVHNPSTLDSLFHFWSFSEGLFWTFGCKHAQVAYMDDVELSSIR